MFVLTSLWVLAAQVTVTGTGDPSVDVPAVQAAVDHGGRVVLNGRFSFGDYAKPWRAYLNRTILISKAVEISGVPDRTVIEGGDNPFAIDAPGHDVAIRTLRFVRPLEAAVSVFAARDVEVSDCRIEGVRAVAPPAAPAGHPTATALYLDTTLDRTRQNRSAPAGKISGRIEILRNRIDVGGSSATQTLGVIVFNAGSSVHIARNVIRNVTERAINIRRPGGTTSIEHNTIFTGSTMGPGGGVQPLIDAIHVVGPGEFHVTANTVESEWANAAAIRIHGAPDPFSAERESGPVERAQVTDNDIRMTGHSATAIEIRRDAHGNVVENNRIRGNARSALSVVADRANPSGNVFRGNDLTGFQSTLADLLIEAGVSNTVISGKIGTVQDHGAGTIFMGRE